MSTLHDLRETLGRYAGAVTDEDDAVRLGAIHQRVRVVRRRRRAAVGSFLAVVLVGGGLGVLTLRGAPEQPRPAERPGRVAGQEIPSGATIAGFDYAYVRGQGVDLRGPGDRLVARLSSPASSVPMAVSLAAHGLGGGEATLYVGSEPVSRALGKDSLDTPVPLDTDPTSLRVEVRDAPSDASVGLAFYRRTAELPPGVRHGDVVFRRDVADKHLLAAAFAGPGETSFGLSLLSHAGGLLSDAPYCVSPDDDLWLTSFVDGHADGSVQCSSAGTPDPGAGGSEIQNTPVAGHHEVRVRLSRGPAGPEVATVPPGTVFGFGAYEDRSSAQRVMGTIVPETIEYGGRTWSTPEIVRRGSTQARTDPLDDELDTVHTNRPGSDFLVGLVARGRSVRYSVTGRLVPPQTGTVGAGSGTFSGIYLLALAGDDYQIDVRDTQGGDFDAALVIYESSDALSGTTSD